MRNGLKDLFGGDSSKSTVMKDIGPSYTDIYIYIYAHHNNQVNMKHGGYKSSHAGEQHHDTGCITHDTAT